ncbi:MAG: class A beta-lactamase-related serine hydrolase [Chloroflexi bacterium]|nr:class A beta-lactamase-related serine hydrolase [Chloroflexota bacterium]
MKSLIRFLFLVLIVAAIVFIGPQWVAFRAGRDAIPPGVTLGGVGVGGATAEEAAANLRQVFESPILVYHDKRRLVLRPEEIDFTIDAESMVAEAQEYGRGLYYLRDFLLYMANQPPLGGDVPLKYDYDREKLAAWLHETAAQYDTDPTPAYANLDSLQWVAGQPGRYTDLNESAIDIIDAFTNAYDREARIHFIEKSPIPPDYEALEKALRERLERFPGVYSLYLQHLPSGATIDIDADTAFSGMSTVKIPILLKIYYDYEQPLPDNITRWISDTVKSTTASNAAANALLYYIGDQDTLTGAQRVTDFVRELGFKNTFIAVPYDSDLIPPYIATPANTNPEYFTNPDPATQTTPRDIGEILAEIGQCAEGKGNLVAAFPDKITPAECEELIAWLEQNPMGYLIKYGAPKDARVAHKHGYGADNQGDVALIYGPEGPYVLAIFVYQAGWVIWDYSNPLMNDLSRLIWNFYAFRQGQRQLPPFEEREQEGNSTG